MNVVVSDIDLERAQAVAKSIADGGAEALGVRTDVSDLASVEELANQTEAAFGGVHLVCNNAGVWVGSLMQNADIRDWRWLVDVNLHGVIHGVHVFLPRLVAQGDGHIVNTASMGGLISGPPEGLYCTTKFAVVGLSEALRMEAAQSGVGVSVLCPGLVKTDIIRRSEALRPHGADAEWQRDVPTPKVDEGIDPDEVGRRVLDAVREDELYVITHDDYRAVLEMRFDGILDAMDRHAARYKPSTTGSTSR
jgi:NADP-dependent 3-hydroxy acid dehydrogenase YdfG